MFGEGGVIAGDTLDVDIAPEVEDFLADGILEAPGEGEGEDHGGDADDGSAGCQAQDEPGEGPLTIESDPAGDEGGYVQVDVLCAGRPDAGF